MLSVTLAALLICPSGIEASVETANHPVRPIHQAVDREATQLAATVRSTSAQQPPPRHRNWFARHPVLTGTIAGAGVGLAFIASEGCSSSDYTCSGLVLFSVGTGAGLGALGGLVAGVILR